MPFFSINIAAFNCETFIMDALASVAAQTFDDWEIVVVDDGSTDNTIETLAKQTTIPAERLVFESRGHRGPWEARRWAHALSSGHYIVTIDADDFLCDVRALEKIHHEIINTGCDVLLFNATRNLSTRKRFVDYSRLYTNDAVNLEPAKLLGIMCVSPALNNISLKAYRREVMDFGVEHDDLVVTEDRLQSFVLLERAESCVLLDEVLYYYRLNPSSSTELGFRPQYTRNMIIVEGYITARSAGIPYNRRERSRFLAGLLVGHLTKTRGAMGSYRERESFYRELHDEARGSGLFEEHLPWGLRPDRAMTCVAFWSGGYRVLDVTLLFRYLALTALRCYIRKP